MTQLVYHDSLAPSGSSSPFDKAILSVCHSGAVCIVSPYIGVDYLQRMIQTSSGWRLISDIEAWLSSLSLRARPGAWQFIRENRELIHHYPAVHAKVVIGQNVALLGSANLTHTGILARAEMAVLIDEQSIVNELGEWFEVLWEQTHSPLADEGDAFVRWLDDEARRAPARRERFSLSASGMKIRARLAKLPQQSRDDSERTGIRLEEVAKALIAKEERHYNSLNEALESAIDVLAQNGFVFRELVDIVRKSYPESTIREIYFNLLQHCANHVHSVFTEKTVNRLVLTKGHFVQSTKESLLPALAPYDAFLSRLVESFEFELPQSLPDEEILEAQTGFRGQNQITLIADLIECGFLEIDDQPGRLPQYVLAESFEWEGRYKLFTRAMAVWRTKKSALLLRSKTKETKRSDRDFEDVVLSERRESLADYLRSEKAKAQAATHAREERQKPEHHQRRHGVDKILAHLISDLFSGKAMPPVKELLIELPVTLEVKASWVKQVLRGKGQDIPKVVIVKNDEISINPRLDWKDLADYKIAQDVCRKFLQS